MIKDFCEEWTKGANQTPLDFSDLYITIGDISLFNLHDLEIALDYYKLSTFSWDKHEKTQSYYNDVYESIYDTWSKDLYTLSKDPILEEKMVYAIDYIINYEQEKKDLDLHQLRIRTITAIRLRNDLLIPVLVKLRHESEEVVFSYKDKIINCILELPENEYNSQLIADAFYVDMIGDDTQEDDIRI